MAARLRESYGGVDRLEWFVGPFAEGYGEDHMVGELLTTMVANDAFTQPLTNLLLAEAVHNEATFGEEGMAIVRGTRTLAEVIARNTKIADPSLVRFKVRGPGTGRSRHPVGAAPAPAPAE
jgi:prostaglandin-endoperoxide synthase 2